MLPLAHQLKADFNVILPDARGHGGSSAPDDGYLYADLASDIVCLIEKLRLEKPVLVGHSMGGLTAVVAAARLGCLIKTLVLVDPTFISPEWQREVFESDISEQHEQTLLTPKDTLLKEARDRNPNRSPALIEALVEARLRASRNAFEVLTPPNPDWRALVECVRVPTLLLVADRGVVSTETAYELQGLNPLLRFELISDAGHGMPYDRPEQVGSAIIRFLRTIANSEMNVPTSE